MDGQMWGEGVTEIVFVARDAKPLARVMARAALWLWKGHAGRVPCGAVRTVYGERMVRGARWLLVRFDVAGLSSPDRWGMCRAIYLPEQVLQVVAPTVAG